MHGPALCQPAPGLESSRLGHECADCAAPFREHSEPRCVSLARVSVFHVEWNTEASPRGLLDPEPWLRHALGAAARAAARASRARASLELEAAGDTARRCLVQLLARVRERTPELLERIGQLSLRYTELARQLV